MSKKNRPGWEQIRKKGKARYIILYWVLGWGVPAAIIATAIDVILEDGFWFSMFFSNDFLSKLLGISVIAIIAGVICGLISWNGQEKIWSDKNK